MLKKLIAFLLLLLLLIPSVTHVVGDMSDDDDDGEEDSLEDIGETTGWVAVGLLGLAMIYVLLKRSYIYFTRFMKWRKKEIATSRNVGQEKVSEVLEEETQPEDDSIKTRWQEPDYDRLLKQTRTVYMKLRIPTFLVHTLISLVATVIAVVHGLTVEQEGDFIFYTGWAAAVMMGIISITGLVMWRKYWPLWTTLETRKIVSFVHRQWLFTGLLGLFLFLHLVVGD